MAKIKELAEAIRGCDPGLRSEIAREAWATAGRWRGLAARLGLPNDQALALHWAAAAEATASSGGALGATAEAMGVSAPLAHLWSAELGGPPRPKKSRWDASAAAREAEAKEVLRLLGRGMVAREIAAEMGLGSEQTVYERRDLGLRLAAAEGGG